MEYAQIVAATERQFTDEERDIEARQAETDTVPTRPATHCAKEFRVSLAPLVRVLHMRTFHDTTGRRPAGAEVA